MKPAQLKIWLLLLTVQLLAGCSSLERTLKFPTQFEDLEIFPYDISTYKNSIHTFNAIDITDKIALRNQEQKISTIDIAIDETIQYDKEIRNTQERIYRQEILRRIIYSIPQNGPKINIWTIGSNQANYTLTKPNIPAIEYHSIEVRDFHQGIDSVAAAIIERNSPSALIIIKEFTTITTQDEYAVDRLRQKMRSLAGLTVDAAEKPWLGNRERLCVYSIGPSNKFSASKIDRVDECGFSITSDHLSQGRNTSHLMEQMIYTAPRDSDHDGIPDYIDRCNDTPPGKIVNADGCNLIDN